MVHQPREGRRVERLAGEEREHAGVQLAAAGGAERFLDDAA
jgi:hypothetical protein